MNIKGWMNWNSKIVNFSKSVQKNKKINYSLLFGRLDIWNSWKIVENYNFLKYFSIYLYLKIPIILLFILEGITPTYFFIVWYFKIILFSSFLVRNLVIFNFHHVSDKKFKTWFSLWPSSDWGEWTLTEFYL